MSIASRPTPYHCASPLRRKMTQPKRDYASNYDFMTSMMVAKSKVEIDPSKMAMHNNELAFSMQKRV